MTNSLLNEILRLSVSERLELIEIIWDSLATTGDEPELTDAQRQELDCRLEAYQQNPTSGSSWEEVKQRSQSRQ